MAEKGHGDGAKTMGNTMEYMAKYGIVWQDMARYMARYMFFLCGWVFGWI
jgi:hypothetical protein